MNDSVQFIYSGDGTINLFVGGNPHTVASDHPNYVAIREALKDKQLDEHRLLVLMNIAQAVKHMSDGKLEIDAEAGIVKWDGVKMDGSLVDRIINLMSEGHDFKYLVNFFKRLMANPSFRAIHELFPFIAKKGFPITTEGKILAYKGVEKDYKDKWTHRIDNTPGKEISMDRDKVCDDRHQACAPGLHAGTLNYAEGYAGCDGRLILIEIDPADVVSVPECETEKMRCCRYRVVRDHNNGQLLEGSVYTPDGKRLESEALVKLLSVNGQFDNETASHWGEEEGRVYGQGDNCDQDDDEDEDEECCEFCGCPVDECECDDEDDFDDVDEDEEWWHEDEDDWEDD